MHCGKHLKFSLLRIGKVLPSKYIAIGTSHAIVLLYDMSQTNLQTFGSSKEQEYGAITAIDMSLRDECLACGYENGNIILWSIQKGDLLKMIPATEKSPVLALKFWKETKNNLISSNAKGVVNLYKLDVILFQWVVEKKVLLSPSNEKKMNKENQKNTIDELPEAFFSIQVLKPESSEENKNKYSLVALVSMRMILVVSLEPVISKVFRYERPFETSISCAPSVSWGKLPTSSKLLKVYCKK